MIPSSVEVDGSRWCGTCKTLGMRLPRRLALTLATSRAVNLVFIYLYEYL